MKPIYCPRVPVTGLRLRFTHFDGKGWGLEELRRRARRPGGRYGGPFRPTGHDFRAALLGMLALAVMVVLGTLLLCRGTSGTTVLADDFETGDFSKWSSVVVSEDATATIQQDAVRGGAHAARLGSTYSPGAHAYLRKTLDKGHLEVRAAGWFNVQGEGLEGSNVPFFRFFDADGERLVSVYRQNGSGSLDVSYGGEYNATGQRIALGSWHRLELRAVVGRSGHDVAEVWLDGAKVYETSTASLGIGPIGSVQLGNETAAQAYTLIADEVMVVVQQ